jgi:hypothetical protein
MFGFMLGTLKEFKTDDKERSSSAQVISNAFDYIKKSFIQISLNSRHKTAKNWKRKSKFEK